MEQRQGLSDEARAEIYLLAGAVLDGSGSPDDLRRLEAILESDEQAQLEYVEFMLDTTNLRLLCAADKPTSIVDDFSPTSSPTPEMPKADPSGFFPALWDSLPSVLDGRTPRATFWILFVFVGSLLFGSFGWLVWSAMPDMHVADAPKPPKPVQPEEPEYAVAYLRDQEGAVWADGAEGIPSGGRGFFEGKTAELASGLVQINFKDGAEVVVEGPCKITFQGRNAARLEQGKLAATVEMSSAQGFIIDTPFGTVTDLGTEFGVEVGDETIDVGVYRGKVSMAVAGSGEVVHLNAGQTARADRQGNITSGSGQPDRLAIVRQIRPTNPAALDAGGETLGRAGPITVTNHSFEADVYAPGDASRANTGWTDVAGSAGTGNAKTAQYPGGIPDGVNYAWFNEPADTLGQDVGALVANTTYTLTVATGWRKDFAEGSRPNYPGYRIELWADGVLAAFDADTTNGGTGSGPAPGTWKDVTASFTTGAVVSGNLEIRLRAGKAVNDGTALQTNYDNVRLNATPVPESGSPEANESNEKQSGDTRNFGPAEGLSTDPAADKVRLTRFDKASSRGAGGNAAGLGEVRSLGVPVANRRAAPSKHH